MQNSQYNKRTEDNKHMIENMDNYMLTNKNIISFLDNCLVIDKVEKKKKVSLNHPIIFKNCFSHVRKIIYFGYIIL